VLTEIDRVNAECFEALGVCRLAVGGGAVDRVATALDVAKFGREEDVAPFAGALEPAPDKLLAIAIETEAQKMRVSWSCTLRYTYLP
jgi:hypothetical protein